MTDDSNPYLVAVDVLPTPASKIAEALAMVAGVTLELSSEVKLEGESFDLVVYPTRPAPEGGNDFLVGGNIWLPRDAALEVIRTVAAALEQARIPFQLELGH